MNDAFLIYLRLLGEIILTHRKYSLLNLKKSVSLALKHIAMCEKLVSF